jgi:hypothetical protein
MRERENAPADEEDIDKIETGITGRGKAPTKDPRATIKVAMIESLLSAFETGTTAVTTTATGIPITKIMRIIAIAGFDTEE